MWGFADRIAKSFADVTVGTVIVLVHVALADRKHQPRSTRDAHSVGHVAPRERHGDLIA